MAGYADVMNPRVFDLDPANASLTGFASNVTGASWTLTAHNSGDDLAHQVSIRNDSANDKSSIAIVLVGTDQNGNAQTESVTGPVGSATVESAGYYLTLTSVTPASTWGADTADIGWVDEFITRTINLNLLAEDIAAINVDVTGVINFTIQQTFDSLDGTLPIVWQTVPGGGSQTADSIWNTTGGAQAVRLVINSYTDTAEIRMNVNQTLMANALGASGGGSGSSDQPFAIGGRTDTITAGTTTGNVAIRDIAGNRQVTVTAPSGGAVAFIKFGTSIAVAAVVADDTPVLPGTVQVFTVPVGTTYAAAITAASTGILYFTPGNGY